MTRSNRKRMTKRAGSAAVIAVLALSACRDERPPRYVSVCQREEFSHFLPVMAGKVVIQVPQYECVESQRRCVVGKDYQGTETCQ